MHISQCELVSTFFVLLMLFQILAVTFLKRKIKSNLFLFYHYTKNERLKIGTHMFSINKLC